MGVAAGRGVDSSGGGAPLSLSPVFNEGSTTSRLIDENTPAGVNIGRPVAARDPQNNTMEYTMRGPDFESFDIGSATGQLLTKAPLDYEGDKNVYNVTVTATDSTGRNVAKSAQSVGNMGYGGSKRDIDMASTQGASAPTVKYFACGS